MHKFANIKKRLPKIHPLIWIVGTSFTLLQFALQLSSAVVINVIMSDMRLSAWTGGLLSGMFYVIYTSLQMPAGILCDHFNPRPILCACACICALGCGVFASSHDLFGLYWGRGLMAVGSGFSFVCLTHLVREHYPKPLFAVLIGATETLSFIAAIFGIVCLGALVQYLGWRDFINITAFLALLCAMLCWRYIPKHSHLSQNGHVNRASIVAVVSSIPLWLNGLFIGLTFLLVTVFGALWAPPFIQMKLQCSLTQASYIDAMFILGVGISCPIFGYLANKVRSRQRLIIAAYLCATSLLFIIIYVSIQQMYIMTGLMFLLGLISGGYILAYTFANELAPPNTLSTTTGLTNTLALIITPILQPLIGRILDILHAGRDLQLQDYQHALTIIPMCLLLAVGMVALLKLPDNHVSKK